MDKTTFAISTGAASLTGYSTRRAALRAAKERYASGGFDAHKIGERWFVVIVKQVPDEIIWVTEPD